jgi:hypothetical protein
MAVRAQECLWIVVASLIALTGCEEAAAQPVPGGVCRPVAERKTEVGCWIMANNPVGQLTRSEIFWHLDVYSTRAAAQQAKGRLPVLAHHDDGGLKGGQTGEDQVQQDERVGVERLRDQGVD